MSRAQTGDDRDRLEHLGCDVLVTPFFSGDSWSTVDLELVFGLGESQDIGVAVGVDALRQALVLRLLTPRGSLASLGHAEYGSRVHELIGEENNGRNRLLLRARVLEALVQEPRVAEVLALEVVPDAVHGELVHVHAQVRPVDAEHTLSLDLEVAL